MPPITEPPLTDLLSCLDSSPYIKIERRTDRVTFRVRDVIVGTLNLATRTVSVNTPSDKVPVLVAGYPRLVAAHDSVSLQVSDTDTRATAETLLHWRTNLERFGPQLRAASP
jgi:hypothetical protein